MPINNTFDIYNYTFDADKTLVNTIVSEVLTQLEISIAANITTFDYSLTTWLPNTLPLVQTNRVIERVLCILRGNGLRIIVKNTPLGPGPDTNLSTPYYTPWFNNVMSYFNTLTVTWNCRNSSEYMKTFV